MDMEQMSNSLFIKLARSVLNLIISPGWVRKITVKLSNVASHQCLLIFMYIPWFNS
ncbi:hypothetical protein MC7420_4690 [Coleofasciculus chthonoplastes PCC 7420]|uniref:Uncharacterized protein n=1 Tax=Coleofasciculus chthonoplastes PCC 7420 TaxID=118168 RepID=B4VN74_9CYAN|nr:hypothetical protein MC7420_4690 [Coleofasciculus chthonoplastes PCC 7420]